jgi:small-conductance mechanosensitive channel
MLAQRRLPQPVRDLLWFVSIGAVVGAVYGHTIAVSDGAPLLGFGGLLRGVLTGVVITGALFSFEQVWAQPAMAQLRGLPLLPHLAIKTVIYLLIVFVGLAIGAGLFPAPAEAGAGLPIRHQDVLFSFAVVLAIRFIDDINHLLGQNLLRNFITGYYHRPRLEAHL